MMVELDSRKKEFQRISDLEFLLTELNRNLSSANERYLVDSTEKYSKIFVVGALRSGTTLLTQWLARTGLVAYPTNILSRFYGAPLVGAKIQQLLTDSRYNFRNEILDFNSDVDFFSENGKTKGALAPNEFWYFWRRFLPFEKLDYLPGEELIRHGDLDGLRMELNSLANIFEKPFALKAMIMNQNINELSNEFEKSLFIWVRRDPVFNVQSALEARRRQYGDINTWYSFKIKEYPQLKDLDPLESVVKQVYYINKSIEKALAKLPSKNKIVLDYEQFCDDPRFYYEEILKKLRDQNGIRKDALVDYVGVDSFKCSNKWHIKEYKAQDVRNIYNQCG